MCIAPVDGKVVVIEEVYEEPEYFKDKRLASIYFYVANLNVHVTRYALSGGS